MCFVIIVSEACRIHPPGRSGIAGVVHGSVACLHIYVQRLIRIRKTFRVCKIRHVQVPEPVQLMDQAHIQIPERIMRPVSVCIKALDCIRNTVCISKGSGQRAVAVYRIFRTLRSFDMKIQDFLILLYPVVRVRAAGRKHDAERGKQRQYR